MLSGQPGHLPAVAVTTTPPPGLRSRDAGRRHAAARWRRRERLQRLSLTWLQRLSRLPTMSLARRRIRLTLPLWRLSVTLLIKLPRLLRLSWRL